MHKLTLKKEEAVPESLKNILLVMANGGYLVPPAEHPDHAHLWEETWKRLDKFLPGMFAELFPEDRETHDSEIKSAPTQAVEATEE